MIYKIKIFNIFTNSNLEITNLNKLKEYIDFCYDNSINERIIGKTAHHHILPRAKNLPFSEYSDLNEIHWNGVHLKYSDHYYAHWLLTQSINHISILSSFCAMHYKDSTLKRITEADLISSEEMQLCMEQRSIKQREWGNTIGKDGLTNYQRKSLNTILSDELIKERSKRMSGTNNIVYLPGVVEKIQYSKNNRYIDGKNMHTITAEKAAATMKKHIIVDGKETTIYRENAKKQSNTLNTIVNYNAENITLAKKYGIERSKRETKKGKIYLIKDIFNEDLNICTYANIVRQISPGLEGNNKENYLGKTKFGQYSLNNKEFLIGLYTVQLDNSINYNVFDDIKEIMNIIKNKNNIFISEQYILKSVFDRTYKETKSIKEVREISQALFNCTKEKYLYKHINTESENKGLYIYKKIDEHIKNKQ